jgi:DNA invertase Pin-like site-specific DNA recombinase
MYQYSRGGTTLFTEYDPESPCLSSLIFHLMGALAEFERNLIHSSYSDCVVPLSKIRLA